MDVTSTYHNQSSSGPRRFLSDALTRYPRVPRLAEQRALLSPPSTEKIVYFQSCVIAFKVIVISVFAVTVLTVWPVSDETDLITSLFERTCTRLRRRTHYTSVPSPQRGSVDRSATPAENAKNVRTYCRTKKKTPTRSRSSLFFCSGHTDSPAAADVARNVSIRLRRVSTVRARHILGSAAVRPR